MTEPLDAPARVHAPLGDVAREWTRIGVTGFGGPPAHIALLRKLVVGREGWMDHHEFEDANAACSLLPGPSSTQPAIFCAYRVAGWPGAITGGLGGRVVATIAAVGYGAYGIPGGLLAAFLPSFSFILLGGGRFERLRASPNAAGFLAGAGPAAIGAIIGFAIPLAGALSETWQFVSSASPRSPCRRSAAGSSACCSAPARSAPLSPSRAARCPSPGSHPALNARAYLAGPCLRPPSPPWIPASPGPAPTGP